MKKSGFRSALTSTSAYPVSPIAPFPLVSHVSRSYPARAVRRDAPAGGTGDIPERGTAALSIRTSHSQALFEIDSQRQANVSRVFTHQLETAR